MQEAKAGDRILVTAAKTGGASREGEILEVIAGDLRIRYRVQWADGHESMYAPGPGAAELLRGRTQGKTHGAKKPAAKKPAAKKPSTTRAGAKKSGAKKS
jgi:hypothetical protein